MTKAEAAQHSQRLSQVRAFWDTEACGTHFVGRYRDDRDFFSRYRNFRYRTEWHIPEFALFTQASGKRVLEIGCGNGADGFMFASNGADYTAVDVTAEAVAATRRHFAAEGLTGDFRQESGDQLSFPDESFDIVYSFGVVHHSPAPELVVQEIHRVLKPGGVALVMLYHRHSFNYYVRILGYMRARILLEILSRAGAWNRDRHHARVYAKGLTGLRGNASKKVWQVHYENFLREGWSYLKASHLVHHCTDGPECPCAHTYSKRDATRLFSRFRNVDLAVAHFPLNKYPGGRWLPRAAERMLSRAVGWHLLIRAVK